MKCIDEKFKEASPADTVARIKRILSKLGINVCETWYDSGVDNCFSLKLSTECDIPFSCGKGVTEDFARASAYGEFIERLQGGLFYYKFQSICRDKDINIHTFAPDAKYMTVEELKENGEWMDYIIRAYKHPLIDRDAIAEQCRIYACADDGKVLTIPFYSLFEDKYVYLPIGFVDQIYATNGCCVGNTKAEAWVHALSEILERHANLEIFTKGIVAPRISDETIKKYPIVSKIIGQIRDSGDFDIDIFDYSMGSGFPVVSTRIINKENQSYKVNVAADPVFEIALQRTLTEIFQGKNLKNFTGSHGGMILKNISDFPMSSNVRNQLETSNGVYTADYFANELSCTMQPSDFADNSDKTNDELLQYLLSIYKRYNKQVYVRNFSYLGFPCYRFVVPGFSEAMFLKLSEPISEYAIGDDVRKTYLDVENAKDDDLVWMLQYSNITKHTFGKHFSYSQHAGIPMSGKIDSFLVCLTRSYAAYKLGRYDDAIKNLPTVISNCLGEEGDKYFSCVKKYLQLKCQGIDERKIKAIIGKFFRSSVFERLYSNLDNGGTPFDEFLIKCNHDCENCNYNTYCCYDSLKRVNIAAGKVYSGFKNGQDRAEFAV